MHVYYNLNNDVKRHFRYRMTYILFLITLNIYFIIGVIMGYTTIFSTSMIILNSIMIINSAIGIWKLVDFNDSSYYNFEPMVVDTVVGGSFTTVVLILYYIMLKDNFITYEFMGMLPYLLVYSAIFIYVILKGFYDFCTFCYNKIIETKNIVEERQRLVEIKTSN